MENLAQARPSGLMGIETCLASPMTAVTLILPVFAATALAELLIAAVTGQTSFMRNFPNMHIHLADFAGPDANREPKNKLQSVDLATRHRRARG